MNSIESFSQNTNTETFTMSAFDTFLIIVHDDTQTETEEAVMTEYHQRMINSVDLFGSAKAVVERHDGEKRKDDYILSLK